MITLSFDISELSITEYLNQSSNIVHFAYNRFHKDKLSLSKVEAKVKSTMNNIPLMDASLIKSACSDAMGVTNEHVIFGSKKNWQDYNYKLKYTKTQEERDKLKEVFHEARLRPVIVRGSKTDYNGNRKFE